MMTKSVLLYTCFVFLVACSSTPIHEFVHYKLTNSTTVKPLKSVVIFPADVTINQKMGSRIVEAIPRWTKKTNQLIEMEAGKIFTFEIGISPTFLAAAEYTDTLRTHAALSERVNYSIQKHAGIIGKWDTWPHKFKKFDYSIGSGLNSLQEKNFDAALIIRGRQDVSIFRIDDSVDNLYLYPNDKLVLNDLKLQISLIDVNSGDLLWVQFANLENFDSRNRSLLNNALRDILSQIPKALLKTVKVSSIEGRNAE